MRDGTSRSVRVIEHEDERAEVLRSAICDDELIQAIGRGRGVNRAEATPLEVHVLADVALPLVHDRVLAWETVVPDVVSACCWPASPSTARPTRQCCTRACSRAKTRRSWPFREPGLMAKTL